MEIRPEDLINQRERFGVKRLEPRIDEAVSKIVGKKVFTLDPRLMKLIVKWKGSKPNDSTKPDDFLRNPEKIKELKQAFNKCHNKHIVKLLKKNGKK